MKEKIEKFIQSNGLTFAKGQRNTDMVVICGYTQSLEGGNRNDLKNVLNPYFKKDIELEDEFNRVWNYTSDNNYAHWWTIESNIVSYVIP